MIFIPYNVSSSKNSKQWTGKLLINSKPVIEYKKLTKDYWLAYRTDFLTLLKGKEMPYRIGFYFIRDSHRRFDYVNVAQLPLDLMQQYNWIADDSMNYVVPVFTGYEVNKEKPGLLLTVL